jgi:hypothetical protein
VLLMMSVEPDLVVDIGGFIDTKEPVAQRAA